MTHEGLIKEFEQVSNSIAEKEITKTKLELDNIDLTSKETMTKLTTALMRDNEEYYSVCTDLVLLKSTYAVLERKVAIVKEMIRAGILTTPNSIDMFVQDIS